MSYSSFVNNDTFYHLDDSKSNEEQLLALAENIKRIHNLTTKAHENLNGLIHDYLSAGVQIFQMQTGIVSNITKEHQYIVKDVVTPLDVINAGDIFELEDTYCREVYKSKKTLGFPHVGDIEALKEHPVYVNLKLESYISAPIYVNTEIYGTLNFTSTDKRIHGFSEHEHDLISLMAQSIGNYIMLEERENNLKRLNFRMKELIGHVVHDLRNPLGGIRELSKVIVKKIDSNPEQAKNISQRIIEEASDTLELVNKVLDEAAIGTGKVVMNKALCDFHIVWEKAQQSYEVLLEQRDIKIDRSGTYATKIFVDENRIEQVLKNLIGNIAKYAKSSSIVKVKCQENEEYLSIRIENEKSADHEALDDKLYKSIGFGIDIVSEILKQHGSKLEIKDSEESYETIFSLPVKEF